VRAVQERVAQHVAAPLGIYPLGLAELITVLVFFTGYTRDGQDRYPRPAPATVFAALVAAVADVGDSGACEDVRLVGCKARRGVNAILIQRKRRIIGDLMASVAVDAVPVPLAGDACNAWERGLRLRAALAVSLSA